MINIECDLQSFESVKKSIKTIIDSCKAGLDILCNNAPEMWKSKFLF